MHHVLRHLDLNLLKTFAVLYEVKSVTETAQRLSLTQPAVSSMLNRLRETFNDPLFIRAQCYMVPTLRAEQLAPQIQNILKNVERLAQPIEFDPATAQLKIKIAATDYSLQTILIPYIAYLRKKAPFIKIAIFSTEDQNTYERLTTGELDFIITAQPHAQLHTHHLFSEHYVCAVHQTHILAKNNQLSIDEFCAAHHLLVSLNGDAFWGISDDVLKQIAQQRHVAVAIQNFAAVPNLLAVTDLMATLPSRIVKGQSQLKTFTPPIDIPQFEKFLAWHERSHHSLAHIWLKDQLIAMCTSESNQS